MRMDLKERLSLGLFKFDSHRILIEIDAVSQLFQVSRSFI